ncbi:hypothetical protein NQ314_012411 [Rhamnusium bicolor]|uniref:Uncharacterized protein n=1 Tax=Rhamnusium bicolor TaxID=1586634 RepID=A0AAV8XC15_9CUCU|nr:hypothetical protein NQ314_012411 [Rhamnusium bicolor]
MIHTIHYLEQQQKILCDLIEKKDRELEEYKMEKGPISRTDLITEKFNSNIMENTSEKLMLNVYGQSTKFWETFIKKHEDVEVKIIDIKVNSWNHIKKKRKIYNSITAAKNTCESISYRDK